MLLRIAYLLCRFRDFIAPSVRRVQRMGLSKWQIGLGLYILGGISTILCLPIFVSLLATFGAAAGDSVSLKWAWQESKHERPEPRGVLPIEYLGCIHDAALHVFAVLAPLILILLVVLAAFCFPSPSTPAQPPPSWILSLLRSPVLLPFPLTGILLMHALQITGLLVFTLPIEPHRFSFTKWLAEFRESLRPPMLTPVRVFGKNHG